MKRKILIWTTLVIITIINTLSTKSKENKTDNPSFDNIEQLAQGECGFGYHCKYYPLQQRCIICNGIFAYCPELECKGKF